ncbi:hypothetical protein HHK36_014237 [Tetracentron sinense]|uniref:non-specific serine/threonine protein kinase n=1 Tax=Tetracentron sinense TaxID=13715 RepID=A0A834Z4Q8_TETSI|nr:hypothetical protein HHK36_014237 [Tetracentron sinense]
MSKIASISPEIPISLLLILLLSLPFKGNSQTVNGERAILLKLKQHWGNPLSLQFWNSSTEPCKWPEILCSGVSVTQISLQKKDINGTIPPFICDLQNLTRIDLANNNIPGEFPTVLYNLPQSRQKYLCRPNSCGSWPICGVADAFSPYELLQWPKRPDSESITNLSNLEHLDLSRNDLMGKIPSDLLLLKNLSHLYLDSNRLSGEIPRSVESLKLVEIDLSGNALTGTIPEDFGKLQNLMDLSLYVNGLSGRIPMELTGLPHLTTLLLDDNRLSGSLPSEIMSWRSLTTLNLGSNKLSSKIPPSIGYLPNLIHLDLWENQFSSQIPPKFGHLRLTTLDLSSNHLTGRIPDEVKNLVDDSSFYNNPGLCVANPFLNHSYFRFNRSVRSDFGNSQTVNGERTILLKLKQHWGNPLSLQFWNSSSEHCKWPEIHCSGDSVTEISLHGENINGTIPPFICDLQNLTHIDLANNNIPGEFPTVLYNCSKLQYLDLSFNYFGGQIPEDIDRISRLQYLNLGVNTFAGKIPAAVGRFAELQTLFLDMNNFNGSFSPNIGNLSNLEFFRLDYNELFLQARIPSEFGRLKKLTYLWMKSTKLIGEIPESITNLSNLEYLDLSGNDLMGKIPSDLLLLKNLSSLHLYNNRLSGEIPRSVEALNLVEIDLSKNALTGTIPEDFGKLQNLTVLKLFENRLSGRIPMELTGLPYLSTLLLDDNRLSGSLPSEIISWKWLTILSLRRNELSSKIPPSIGYLTRLIDLDLSENQFSGQIPPEIGHLRLAFVNLSYNQLTGRIPDEVKNLVDDRNFYNNPGLCAANPFLNHRACYSKPPNSSRLSPRFLAMILVLGVALVLVALLIAFFVIQNYHRRKHARYLVTWKMTSFQRLQFTESRILSSLTENNLIGSGGSGKVYRIAINSSGDAVAVKKIWNNRKLDQKLEKEFLAEVQILGSIRHSNIVKLLCCLSSEESKLLVYEYMENRSLDRWLHGKRRSSAVSEYAYTTKVNQKIDVYSFGVVLLELATGREATDGDDEHTCLAEWAWRQLQDGNSIVDALDEGIKEPCYLDEMSSLFKLGIICTGTLPSTRPSMKEVLQILLRGGGPP